MAEVIGKIKVVRYKLEDFKKRLSTFGSLSQSLKDSEIFLNIQVTDLSQDFQIAKSLHSEIIANGDENIPEVAQYLNGNVFRAIQNVYYKYSTSLHELLKTVSKSEKHDVTFSEVSNSTFRKINYVPKTNSTSVNHPYDLTFSYIQGSVPIFDGSYDKWPDFKDTFLSNVHENSSLTDNSKLKILHSLLKDDALKVVKREFGSLISQDYAKVWEKLNSRYNHKRTIVYSYLNLLIFQPALEKETADGIKSLYDNTYDSIASLSSLGLKCEEWGDILLFIVYSKLPLKTKGIWDEKQCETDSLPEFSKFLQFLEQRFRTLEHLDVTRNNTNVFAKKSISSKKLNTFQLTNSTTKISSHSKEHEGSRKFSCRYCNKPNHSIKKCFKFKKLKPQERLKFVSSLDICINCLGTSHKLQDCQSSGKCEICNEKHNSLFCLHSNNINQSNAERQSLNSSHQNHNPTNEVPSTSDGRFSNHVSNPYTHATLMSESEGSSSVIFPTALVKVLNADGQSIILRAMIDACSDASYITTRATRKLGLPVKRSIVQISGLGDNPTAESRGIVRFEIQSLINKSFTSSVAAYVLEIISPNRPVKNFRLSQELGSIYLADPNFKSSSQIDMLLGGDINAVIHKTGSFKADNIVFNNTELGWIASGSVPLINCFTTSTSERSLAQNENLQLIFRSLDSAIRNFWTVEELPVSRLLTEEERLCDEIYNQTTVRLPTGQYSVCLPFKHKVEGFCNMRRVAISRFNLLEKRFSKNDFLRKQYVECLQEYIELDHMTEVDPLQYVDGYYIPHHCVLKESSSTTKLRVVFDASAKDSKLQCLNGNLLNGPRLQPDLLDHLLRFRLFKVAFTADVAKMYRQILINPNDMKFQLIVWRPQPSQELKTYALKTVTFGTTSAPYLAVKTLIRLSEDEKMSYPKGADCLKRGFYVDDCIYGADNLDEALDIQHQTRMILQSAGFHLRKWSSNCEELLKNVPESDRETKTLLNFDLKSSVKTLGVQWSPKDDDFHYSITFKESLTFTKRNVLSEVAKLFDPLGWISPCIIKAKILIQRLWSEAFGWDDPLPSEINQEWLAIRKGLSNISQTIKIPRWLGTRLGSQIEIHGFSDASQSAYAAVIYVKSKIDDDIHVNILYSKTKVAPLKKISLPRLELMGALLLARMVDNLKSILEFKKSDVFYWSDSQIALAWIKDEPYKRTVFVANRVSEIQSLTCPSKWKYVETKSNPADLGTRGILGNEISNLNIWWHGPEFIKTFEVTNHEDKSVEVMLPKEDNKKEERIKSSSIISTFLNNRKTSLHEIASNLINFSFCSLNKFSTLGKLVRIVGYCLRFKKKNRCNHIFISPIEYERALLLICKLVQEEVYFDEFTDIQSGGLSTKSNIYSLSPFINNDDGLLRVSGRLQHAEHLNYDQKHPIILPYNHVVSRLIVLQAHNSTLHGTEQQTYMLVTQRFHIVRCKSLIKLVTNKCIKCFKYKCTTQQQLMGQLPITRITPNRPFLNCGADFAGPFEIKKYHGRCKTFYKSYFALFVCFTTKAVHLEVVIDLSSPSFIAAYRRFISRRGLVKNMYSDCGSNFIGSQKTITRSMSIVENQWNEIIAGELAAYNTTWHYNPPGAPHFGGLWEAGVKSVKHHLKRIIGNTRLTYDEFETVLLQVEACLNSRPLCQVKNAEDIMVLTPAHFLVQGNLLTLPDDNFLSKNISPSDRWNILQKILQSFWKVWNCEYLNTLRQRSKWKLQQSNIKINDIVILKEPNTPPNSWLLAIVVEVHPGSDGIERVVSLKVKNKIIKRPIVKICPLPINKSE